MSKQQIPWKYIDWAKKELANKYGNPWGDKAQQYWKYLINCATKKWQRTLKPHHQ